jgi:hypothetical protein
MYEQIPANVVAYGKLVADSAIQANSLAAEGLARIARSQLKVIEGRLAAADAFWSEAAGIRDAEGLKTIWPKSVNLAKETSETLYANGKEVLETVARTGEAIGQLARRNVERASETFGTAS